jgi:hypothetical protein
MSKLRQKWYWLYLITFLGTCALVVSVRCQGDRHNISSEADLIKHLTRLHSGWSVLPQMSNGSLEGGVYLYDPQVFTGDPRGLFCLISKASKWRGVVLIQAHKPTPVTYELLQEWGSHAALVGPWLIFGDPDLVSQIARDLEDRC